MIALVATAALLCQEPPAERKFEHYKAMLENNIFSPPKPKPPEKKPEVKPQPEKKPDPPPPAPDPILVTGFYQTGAEAYEAVVENKKKKQVRFVRPGDEVEGWKVVSIAHDKLVAEKEGGRREFKAGEAVAGTAPPPPPTEQEMLGEAEVDAKKLDEARRRLRERMAGKKQLVEDEEPEPARNRKDK